MNNVYLLCDVEDNFDTVKKDRKTECLNNIVKTIKLSNLNYLRNNFQLSLALISNLWFHCVKCEMAIKHI